MKNKIILAFTFALLALTLIGFVGQHTLTQLIVSIEKDAQPNQKIIALKEILADLSDAENSVRTYTITRESENLTPFYESISTIDHKINRLYQHIKNKEQIRLVDSMHLLIERKYGILKQLIDIKKDQDTEEILERVLENIAKLREKDSIPQPITYKMLGEPESNFDRIQKVDIPKPKKAEKKLSIFQRIFGGNNNVEAEEQEEQAQQEEQEIELQIVDQSEVTTPDTVSTSDSSTGNLSSPFSSNDVNSSDIGQIITKIGKERNQNMRAIREQELALTLRDNDIMQHIREVANLIEDREKNISLNRQQAAQRSTERAISFITVTWVVALFIFAIMLFIIFSDISRSQKNREQLRKAKVRAEKLAKVKEQFLSNMSHEIRTPLNSIIGYTEQLQETRLEPVQEKYLGNIYHSGEHLLRLINDILDFAKLESGKLPLEAIGFNIRKNIDEVVESFQTQADKKDLQILTNVDDIPEVLIGDPVRFDQILMNLLSNAVKFADSGVVEVTLKTLETTKDNEVTLRLRVADSGVGIPKEKLNSIFGDFAQVDSSTTRKYGGTGLGLSIVQKIVKLHDGHIAVESEEGAGTTFIIDLKYRVGNIQDLKKEPVKKTTTHYDQLAHKEIMVVDDQEYNLELIQVIFDKWKIASTILTSGQQAIDAMKDNSYDLILMDIQMPGMSGLEATKEIREIERQLKEPKHTPILALTAAASKEDTDDCLQAGMDGYILKPFTQAELYNKLTGILLGKNGTPIDRVNDKPPATHVDVIDLEDLHHLSNGDINFVINMLNIYLNNFNEDLKGLISALEHKEWQKVKLKAHKMIPPCRHLGLNTLVTLLKQIEARAEEDRNYEKIKKMVMEVSENYGNIKPAIEAEIIELKKRLSESMT